MSSTIYPERDAVRAILGHAAIEYPRARETREQSASSMRVSAPQRHLGMKQCCDEKAADVSRGPEDRLTSALCTQCPLSCRSVPQRLDAIHVRQPHHTHNTTSLRAERLVQYPVPLVEQDAGCFRLQLARERHE